MPLPGPDVQNKAASSSPPEVHTLASDILYKFKICYPIAKHCGHIKESVSSGMTEPGCKSWLSLPQVHNLT